LLVPIVSTSLPLGFNIKLRRRLVERRGSIKHLRLIIDLTDIDLTLTGWLKDRAPLNMSDILVTRLTFHCDNGWLNDEASRNIPDIMVTRLTFHCDNGWLNDEAPQNIPHISVT
jgi:hypothetical protein